MASRRTATASGLTITPDEGGNALLAAWRGLSNLFGAKVEKWEVSNDGVTAVGLTVAEGFDASQIVADVKTKNHRVDFMEGYPIISGAEVEPFTTPAELTSWQSKFLGGAEDSRSPKYSKDAIAAYKAAHGFLAPRGRPRKNIAKIDLDAITANAEALGISAEEADKFKDFVTSMVAPAAEPEAAV